RLTPTIRMHLLDQPAPLLAVPGNLARLPRVEWSGRRMFRGLVRWTVPVAVRRPPVGGRPVLVRCCPEGRYQRRGLSPGRLRPVATVVEHRLGLAPGRG